jgi:lysophospholipid acyltransferase (LPLAT)-like uncharacterized protein
MLYENLLRGMLFNAQKRKGKMIKHLSRLAIRFGLISLLHYVIRMYLLMIRITVVNETDEKKVIDRLEKGQKMIAAIWHQRIFVVMGYARRFSRFSPSVMISQSRDGDMIAAVYRRFHFRPVRGSSSRGGKEALAAMISDLEQNLLAVQVLDGPRGPRGIVKPGLLVMAQSTGAPIYPVYISVDRAWVLNSWDRTLIPKPFSRISVRWGAPFIVQKEMDEVRFENMRKQIEQQMKKNQSCDDQKFGWQDFF